MAIANTNIRLRKSGVSSTEPTSLEHGELALNYADGKLFYKHANGSIASISSGISTQSDSFSTISANGSLIIATSPSDILTLSPGSGISITPNTSSKTITIGSDAYDLANSAATSAQAAFDRANSVSANATTVITGGTYVDYGWVPMIPAPILFDYGTL